MSTFEYIRQKCSKVLINNGDRVIGLDRAKSSLKIGREQQCWRSIFDTDEFPVAALAKHRQTHDPIDVLVTARGPTRCPIRADDARAVVGGDRDQPHGDLPRDATLLPLMKDEGWGRIMNIGSASAFEGVGASGLRLP
jgi:NADP-dependent 3-hydroxy acid dehydrogenase YdfG